MTDTFHDIADVLERIIREQDEVRAAEERAAEISAAFDALLPETSRRSR